VPQGWSQSWNVYGPRFWIQMKKLWRTLLKIAVSGGLLTYLFLAIDLGQVGSILKQVNLLCLVGAFAVILAASGRLCYCIGRP